MIFGKYYLETEKICSIVVVEYLQKNINERALHDKNITYKLSPS
jgi:hypothetical protein